MTTKQKQKSRTTSAMLTPELKACVLAEAAEIDSNMTDVIVAKLAARFGVPFDPAGRTPSRGNPDQLEVNLRMPAALYRKLWEARVRQDSSVTAVVCETLASAYGLDGS